MIHIGLWNRGVAAQRRSPVLRPAVYTSKTTVRQNRRDHRFLKLRFELAKPRCDKTAGLRGISNRGLHQYDRGFALSRCRKTAVYDGLENDTAVW